MISFQWQVSKLVDQAYLFLNMCCMKGHYCSLSFTELASLFGFSNVIFHRHLLENFNKFPHKWFRFSTTCLKINTLSVTFLWICSVWKDNPLGPVLRKWWVSSDFVTQNFSRFESGFASHGKRQQICIFSKSQIMSFLQLLDK